MISVNQWTPLFQEIKSKLDERGKRLLLSRLIGTVQSITIETFGADGVNRPEPWPELKRNYAQEWHGGDTTPTLLLSDEKHSLAAGEQPHLIDSFTVDLTSQQATLTNVSPYADIHQFGLGVIPARPFYPIDKAGGLTPYAESRLMQVTQDYFQLQSP